MKKMGLTVGVVMVAMLIGVASEANAQRFHGRRAQNSVNRVPVYSGTDAEGMTMTSYDGRVNILRSMKMASHNHYSPHRLYTYRNNGLEAGRTHTWNQQQAAQKPWHGEYQNWRWRQPTALVVPPTAAYESSYAWGVGQVQSNPIHHQFGVTGAGVVSGGEGFKQTPVLAIEHKSVRSLPSSSSLVTK